MDFNAQSQRGGLLPHQLKQLTPKFLRSMAQFDGIWEMTYRTGGVPSTVVSEKDLPVVKKHLMLFWYMGQYNATTRVFSPIGRLMNTDKVYWDATTAYREHGDGTSGDYFTDYIYYIGFNEVPNVTAKALI